MLENSSISSNVINNKVINSLTYYIETYGCQMNVSDSELVSSELEKIGYTSSDKIQTADLILLNTCSIREKAEQTVHNRFQIYLLFVYLFGNLLQNQIYLRNQQ